MKNFNTVLRSAGSIGTMGAETISKNAASLEKPTNRINLSFFVALAFVATVALCFTSCSKDDDDLANLTGTSWTWDMMKNGGVPVSIQLDFTSKTQGKIKQVLNGTAIGSGTNFTYEYEYDGNEGEGVLFWSSKAFEFTVRGKNLTFEEDAVIGDLYLGDAVFKKK
jgi:hypothetical protein